MTECKLATVCQYNTKTTNGPSCSVYETVQYRDCCNCLLKPYMLMLHCCVLVLALTTLAFSCCVIMIVQSGSAPLQQYTVTVMLMICYKQISHAVVHPVLLHEITSTLTVFALVLVSVRSELHQQALQKRDRALLLTVKREAQEQKAKSCSAACNCGSTDNSCCVTTTDNCVCCASCATSALSKLV
eukprot:4124-Heterococcus_DN1.PRE.2